MSSGDNNNKNRILGLEICAVAKEAAQNDVLCLYFSSFFMFLTNFLACCFIKYTLLGYIIFGVLTEKKFSKICSG